MTRILPRSTAPETNRQLNPLRRFVAETYTPPFAEPIPSNVEAYAASAPAAKLLWRRLRRSLWLAVNGQRGLERQRIEPAHRRILWIHRGMPQVGDSLMDLACRVLLRGRVERLDLLTDPHLSCLYESDDVFANVYADGAAAAASDYDLVILLSASSHSLGDKLRRFRRLPFVNLHRYYTGPEFHRTMFGFLRMDQLLGSGLGLAGLEPIAVPHMVVGAAVRAAVDALALPSRFVAVALGGVRAWRTYAHWPAVLKALAAGSAGGAGIPVLLLGSGNARAARDAVLARAPGQQVIDRVEQQSLPEAFEILRRAAVLACADGGLMHVAHAANTPTVALFAERIDPRYRLTTANRSIAFYARLQVSDIPPQRIAAAIATAWRDGVDGVSITSF